MYEQMSTVIRETHKDQTKRKRPTEKRVMKRKWVFGFLLKNIIMSRLGRNLAPRERRYPAKRSLDKDEKKNGNWISLQKTNYDSNGAQYSKQSMKNPELWTTWNDTLRNPECMRYKIKKYKKNIMNQKKSKKNKRMQ